MKSFTRKTIFTVSFLIIDLILAAGAAEIWTRNFIAVKNICYVFDDTIGVRFCPNQRTYGYVEKGYANILETNGLGFHDRDRKPEKDPGVFRVQIYGDSMIQGYGVPTEETIPILMEKNLSEGNPPVKVEVANLAPGDDGTSSQIMTFHKIGKTFKPDLVICYFMDDFADNLFRFHPREYSPYHKLTADEDLVFIPPAPKGEPGLWERFKKSSKLYRLLANKLLESKFYNELKGLRNEASQKLENFTRPAAAGEKKDYLDLRREICINESWPLTLRLIRHFRDQVEAEGAKFALADGQVFYDVNVGTRYKNRDLEDFCRKNGIAYIPAYMRYAQLKSSPEKSKYFFLDDHMKSAGTRAMSRFLAGEVKKFIPALKELRN